MTQTETTQVKVQIEANGIRYEACGRPEEIVPQLLQFLTQSIPTYSLARKLIHVSDLASLADKISQFAKMTTSGQLLLTRNDLPAGTAISILLFMGHLAGKMGKRENDLLTIEEIVTGVSKAPKTVRNAIVTLQKSGSVGRADRGRYRITTRGLMRLEMLLSELHKGGPSK